MRAKKKPGSEWTDPDDAPPLTAETLQAAEIFEGNTFCQRRRKNVPDGGVKVYQSG
jgi:hypothetical protein